MSVALLCNPLPAIDRSSQKINMDNKWFGWEYQTVWPNRNRILDIRATEHTFFQVHWRVQPYCGHRTSLNKSKCIQVPLEKKKRNLLWPQWNQSWEHKQQALENSQTVVNKINNPWVSLHSIDNILCREKLAYPRNTRVHIFKISIN